MNIHDDYNEIKNEITEIRRKIHQNPELSFEEFKTSETICKFLDKYGITYTAGIAKTGVCAIIGDAAGGKVIALRADMDALPFEEKTGLPYASAKPGVMHACGHDIHTASALAACYILKKHESELSGCVKVIFQPGEETTGGAQPMIDEGVLENPKADCCLGLHVTPSYPLGELYFKDGALMASPDDFRIEFVGKSAHGAEPQNGINPIEAAAEFAAGIKAELAKQINFESNVYTICSIHSGTTNNIIPDTAIIEGTFRSFGETDRHLAEKIMIDAAKQIDKKYGTKTHVKYNYLYPPLINDAKMCRNIKSFAENEFGKAKIKEFEKPLMTGEDFAYFTQNVPSAFVWIGCAIQGKNCSLHSSEFEADENVMETAARLFAGYAIEYVNG